MGFCSLKPWFGVMLFSLLIHFLTFQYCCADANSTLVVNASFDEVNARRIPHSFLGVFFEVYVTFLHLITYKMDSGVSFFIVMTLLKFDRNFILKTLFMARPLMLNRFLNNVYDFKILCNRAYSFNFIADMHDNFWHSS